MMEEAKYKYIKGEGWVPYVGSEYPTLEMDIGLYHVVFEVRQPQEGENFFVESDVNEQAALHSLANALSVPGYWPNVFTRDEASIKRDELPVWEEYRHKRHRDEVEKGTHYLIVLKISKL